MTAVTRVVTYARISTDEGNQPYSLGASTTGWMRS